MINCPDQNSATHADEPKHGTKIQVQNTFTKQLVLSSQLEQWQWWVRLKNGGRVVLELWSKRSTTIHKQLQVKNTTTTTTTKLNAHIHSQHPKHPTYTHNTQNTHTLTHLFAFKLFVEIIPQHVEQCHVAQRRGDVHVGRPCVMQVAILKISFPMDSFEWRWVAWRHERGMKTGCMTRTVCRKIMVLSVALEIRLLHHEIYKDSKAKNGGETKKDGELAELLTIDIAVVPSNIEPASTLHW
jgi:hypothetical protein